MKCECAWSPLPAPLRACEWSPGSTLISWKRRRRSCVAMALRSLRISCLTSGCAHNASRSYQSTAVPHPPPPHQREEQFRREARCIGYRYVRAWISRQRGRRPDISDCGEAVVDGPRLKSLEVGHTDSDQR